MSRRRNRKTQPARGTRTVRDVRQVLITGSVADVAARIPARPDTDHITLGAPGQVITQFRDADVEAAITYIDKTGIAGFVDTAYADMKKKSGRPATMSTRTVLVAMQLAVRDSRPLLITEIRTILHCRLSPGMRRRLDVPNDPRPTEQTQTARWAERTATRVRRTLHRMLAPIDPSIMPKNRIRSADEAERLKKDLSVKEQQDRAIALDYVCNQLTEAAYQQLPQSVRDRYQQKSPSYCIDATPLPLFARGQGLKKDVISADSDGGWYTRIGDHGDPAETQTTKPDKFERTTDKLIWAREIHLIVTADASHPDRLYMPSIPLAATTDVPGRDPAGAARRLFANLAARDHTPGALAGDILYTNQDEAKFQSPAREHGYDLVLGYGKNQLGVQGAHPSGALLLDGMYVAPCIPDDLVEATRRRSTGEITSKQFGAFIKARVEYRMRTKETSDRVQGRNERLTCPAAGPKATAMCALKPKSMHARPTHQPDGAVVDVRRVIDHRKVLTDSTAPTVCQQESITITPRDGAKFRQTVQYGSEEQTAVYHRLRQSQEGVHGTAKDEAGVAMAHPGRRRVRGWAAQQLFAAFLLAETATRRIHRFLTNAKTDRNGDLYVDRHLMADKSPGDGPAGGTTGSLPGAQPDIEDDPPEAA